MKIILLEAIKKTGQPDDLVEVKDGYGQFLIQQGKAILAGPAALRQREARLKTKSAVVAKHLAEAETIFNQLKTIKIDFPLKVKDNQVFGSITSKQVLAEINKQVDNKIEKHHLVDFKPIKTIGATTVEIKLTPKLIAKISVHVHAVSDEAE